MSKWVRAIALAFGLSLVLSMGWFGSKCADIRDEVLRLHVLANSDSDEDQALKLKVRDTVLEHAAGMFDASTDREQACAKVASVLEELEQVAEQRVKDEGYDYPVKVELVETYFTTRTYDTVTLPAGDYQAVRVSIGEAKGQNWWCVVFPPLCVSASTNAAAISDVLSAPEQEIVNGGKRYAVRFKVVEWWEELVSRFRR